MTGMGSFMNRKTPFLCETIIIQRNIIRMLLQQRDKNIFNYYSQPIILVMSHINSTQDSYYLLIER